jgi:hypothetical protein
MSDIQVSIVTYNSAAHIERCITSLLDNPELSQNKVFLFDNASADNTVETVERAFPEVQITTSPENLGFATGHNRNLARNGSDLVLLINPDAAAAPDLVNRLHTCLQEYAEAAIAAPRVNYPDGFPQVSFGDFPRGPGDAEHRRAVFAAQGREEWIRDRLEEKLAQVFKTQWCSGSCFLARRAPLAEAGYFDEGYFLYMEDVDLCRRLHRAGYDVLVEPAAVCHHIEGGSAGETGQTRNIFRRSKLRYLNKFHSFIEYAAYALLRNPSALFSYDPSLKVD